MKRHLEIFFSVIVIICGITENCKADTIDNYQIYIGQTLKLTEASFNPLRSTLPFLRLDSSNNSEALNINLNHCTLGASGRQLKLTDTSGKTILLWEFGDKDQKSMMSISINEILTNAAVRSNSSLNLYYIDQEYPVWRFLTPVYIGKLNIEKKEQKAFSNNSDKTNWPYIVVALIIVVLAFIILRQTSPHR